MFHTEQIYTLTNSLLGCEACGYVLKIKKCLAELPALPARLLGNVNERAGRLLKPIRELNTFDLDL